MQHRKVKVAADLLVGEIEVTQTFLTSPDPEIQQSVEISRVRLPHALSTKKDLITIPTEAGGVKWTMTA